MNEIEILPYKSMPNGMISKGYLLEKGETVEAFAEKMHSADSSVKNIYYNPKTKTAYTPKC